MLVVSIHNVSGFSVVKNGNTMKTLHPQMKMLRRTRGINTVGSFKIFSSPSKYGEEPAQRDIFTELVKLLMDSFMAVMVRFIVHSTMISCLILHTVCRSTSLPCIHPITTKSLRSNPVSQR